MKVGQPLTNNKEHLPVKYPEILGHIFSFQFKKQRENLPGKNPLKISGGLNTIFPKDHLLSILNYFPVDHIIS